jgi:hypothetical protein
MWITIFALTFATAIIFSVASYMLHTWLVSTYKRPRLKGAADRLGLIRTRMPGAGSG